MTHLGTTDFFNEVRLGKVPGYSIILVSGHNPDVDVNAESIWPEGGVYQWPSSGSQMTLSSSDTNDNSSGSGARIVRLRYLNSSYEEQSETITLNGQNGVNTVATDIYRFVEMRVTSAGSSDVNEGSVYIGTGSIVTGKPTNVYGVIAPSQSKSCNAFYTIPDGKTGYLRNGFASANTGKFVELQLLWRNGNNVWITEAHTAIYQQAVQIPMEGFGGLPEHTDIDIRTYADSAGAEVHAAYSILLKDN